MELLIVVAIMVVVAAFLIPAIKPALEDRKIREAARMTNVFLAGAQARAIERGRPVGVWLERNPNSPNECIQLYMAEVPLPYSGDLLGARTVPSGGGFGSAGTAQFDASSASLPSLVQMGDQIRFGYKGPYYTVTGVPAAGTPAPFQITFTHPSAPPPQGSLGVPYQILRQPSRLTSTTFALPLKTAINLHFSGAGAAGFGPPASGGGGAAAATDTTPILIMFSPAGRLDRIYARDPADTAADPLGRWKGIQATQAVYLFVNRNDKQAADGSSNILGFENLEDTTNLWIAVGHNTGSVTTVDNVNTQLLPVSTLAEQLAKVAEARRFAREKTSIGGR